MKNIGIVIEKDVEIKRVYHRYFAIHLNINYEYLERVLHAGADYKKRKYTITHIPTGYAIASLSSVSRCMDLVRAIKDKIDWSSDSKGDIFFNGTNNGIGETIKEHNINNL